MKKTLLILFFSLLLTGCSDKSTEPEKSNTGSADFRIYAAIGNSVTAGFQSNSLFEEGQKYSYPNLIARQVNTNFAQPIISEPGIHTYRIIYKGKSPGGWFLFDREFDRGELTNADYGAPYNNLGVPGARLMDVLHTTNMFNTASGINPFFDLVLRNYIHQNGTQFQQAKRLKPTFLTLWIGNNDILGYAMGGAASGEPTSNEEFYTEYKALVDSIKTLNTNVITATIPDVTVLPYFTAIEPNPTINNTEYNYYGVTTNGIRKLIKGTDYITLSAAEIIFDKDGNRTLKGLSVSDPLPDKDVLDGNEISHIRTIINNYNNSIETLSSLAGFLVADLHSTFNKLKAADSTGGITIDGLRLQTDFVTGGLFSLDGIHPSSRGQGIIANEFIKLINESYHAEIPLVNIAEIPELITSEVI